jgi:hypothetical protein
MPAFLPRTYSQLGAPADLGSRPVGVIVAASAAQRAQLLRLRERQPDNVVPVTGAEITRLLIGSAPMETLARVLAREIDLSRISPYQINNAIERDSVFFGRYQQLRHILERDLGNYILLGARQLGKSSLLKEIERRVRRRGEVAVMYEMVQDDPIESVLARLAGMEEGASLSDLTTALHVSAAERPRLILLDECDKFVANDLAQDPPFPVMDAMRRLSASGNCHFIIAGFWQLYEIVHLTYHAPLRNFGETLILGGLEPEAAHALLHEPMAVLGVSWQDEADIERIAAETGRRPNLLQIAGNELLKTLGARRVIESGDVDLVLRSRPVADSLAGWRTLTDDPRALPRSDRGLGYAGPRGVYAPRASPASDKPRRSHCGAGGCAAILAAAPRSRIHLGRGCRRLSLAGPSVPHPPSA